MKDKLHVVQGIGDIYQWLEGELAKFGQSCNACGKCCDFESFGHKLYVTSPELMYFRHHLRLDVKEMSTGVCPYRKDGKCTVYPYRFSGCRIFSCKGNTEKENALCEKTIQKLKSLCERLNVPYNYVNLKSGLEMARERPEFEDDS